MSYVIKRVVQGQTLYWIPDAPSNPFPSSTWGNVEDAITFDTEDAALEALSKYPGGAPEMASIEQVD